MIFFEGTGLGGGAYSLISPTFVTEFILTYRFRTVFTGYIY